MLLIARKKNEKIFITDPEGNKLTLIVTETGKSKTKIGFKEDDKNFKFIINREEDPEHNHGPE